MRFAVRVHACRRRIYEPCTRAGSEFVLVRHGMWSGSLECARAGADASGEGHWWCACYSSRFLSPRNALAIIAART